MPQQQKTEKAAVPVPRSVTVDVSSSVSNSVQLIKHEKVSAAISSHPSMSYVSGDHHAPIQTPLTNKSLTSTSDIPKTRGRKNDS